MTGTIYGFADPESLEVRYIGMTRHYPEERLSTRLREMRRGSETYVARWLRKLTARPIVVTLQEEVPLAELGQVETTWIAAARGWGWRLTNMGEGGEGNPGFTHTEETRRRLSEIQKGRQLTPEWRERIRAAALARSPRSAAHRAAIAASRAGRPPSEEARRKIAATLTGRRATDASKVNRSETRRQALVDAFVGAW